MHPDRRTACAALAGATVTLLLDGCGGGGYGSSPAPPAGGGPTCGAGAGDISANHGHTLTIPRADLDSPVDKTYALGPSTEGHTHNVTFTPARLLVLKGGGTVVVTSTVTAASALYGGTHSHDVTATVAASCA